MLLLVDFENFERNLTHTSGRDLAFPLKLVSSNAFLFLGFSPLRDIIRITLLIYRWRLLACRVSSKNRLHVPKNVIKKHAVARRATARNASAASLEVFSRFLVARYEDSH